MSEAIEILKSCDAFLEGHFLLSSGRHSSAYCQMAYLQQYPDRCAEVMAPVAAKIKELGADVIVGPAMGGIVYAYELARQTGLRAIFTERVDNVMTLKRFRIHPGERCIIAEDVVTTGVSSLETKRVIEEAGGVCLNWGCIPTKALLKSAQVYTYCRSAEHYGLELTGEVRPDLAKIVARSRGVAETMSKGVQFLLRKNAIDLIQGFGRLTAPGHLDVDGTPYEADHIILATGARPREMPFMPVDGVKVLSSRHALTLDRLPGSMIVVGSGAIGSEFAWFYAALGVKVTVVEYLPRMMPLEDEEVSKTMERAFRKLRATVLTSTTVKGVTVNADGQCEVAIEGKKGAESIDKYIQSK